MFHRPKGSGSGGSASSEPEWRRRNRERELERIRAQERGAGAGAGAGGEAHDGVMRMRAGGEGRAPTVSADVVRRIREKELERIRREEGPSRDERAEVYEREVRAQHERQRAERERQQAAMERRQAGRELREAARERRAAAAENAHARATRNNAAAAASAADWRRRNREAELERIRREEHPGVGGGTHSAGSRARRAEDEGYGSRGDDWSAPRIADDPRFTDWAGHPPAPSAPPAPGSDAARGDKVPFPRGAASAPLGRELTPVERRDRAILERMEARTRRPPDPSAPPSLDEYSAHVTLDAMRRRAGGDEPDGPPFNIGDDPMRELRMLRAHSSGSHDSSRGGSAGAGADAAPEQPPPPAGYDFADDTIGAALDALSTAASTGDIVAALMRVQRLVSTTPRLATHDTKLRLVSVAKRKREADTGSWTTEVAATFGKTLLLFANS